MGTSTPITATFITHQCVVLDYCLEATLRSMLDLCDEIYVNDGKSTDGTLDVLYSIQREVGSDRLKVFERDWVHDRSVWTKEKNFLIDQVPANNYVLCIDADEVIHENDIPKIRSLVNSGTALSIAFPVIHFYGRPTHYIEGPSWYTRHTRLWAKSTGIRLYHIERGCADDVLWPNRMPAHLWRFTLSEAFLYHYGNCRDPRAIGMKVKKADDLYQYSTDYIDGKLAKERSFSYAFDKVDPKEFKGSHPKYIKEWYDSHRNQSTSYDAKDNEDNKLWCFNN